MIMNESKMCIYISTPKSYSDVFEVFVKCFKKYWNNCKYPIYVSSNYDCNCSPDFTLVYNSNNLHDGWVDRTIKSLEMIEYDYVLLMMDDTLIWNKPNEEYLDYIISDMDKFNINYCKLSGLKRGKRYNDSKVLNKVKKNTPYGKNLFLGIFRRNYLIRELKNNNLSSWELEKKWLLDAANASSKEYFEDITRTREKVFDADNAVISGKWFRTSYKKIKKNGFFVDSSREVVSFWSEIKLKLGGKLGKLLHPRIRHWLKRVLKKLGFKFKYDV